MKNTMENNVLIAKFMEYIIRDDIVYFPKIPGEVVVLGMATATIGFRLSKDTTSCLCLRAGMNIDNCFLKKVFSLRAQ